MMKHTLQIFRVRTTKVKQLFFFCVFRKGVGMQAHVFILFSFMISLHCKFTGIFNVILVSCDDVYLYCTVFVSIFERIASKNNYFYYAYVAKLCKAKNNAICYIQGQTQHLYKWGCCIRTVTSLMDIKGELGFCMSFFG